MKKLNFDLKSIPTKAKQLLLKVRKYVIFIFFIVAALMYSFLLFRINSLANHEPTDDQISERLQTVHRPKIDQSAINKIQQLQDNSTDVQALFQQARDNPFQE